MTVEEHPLCLVLAIVMEVDYRTPPPTTAANYHITSFTESPATNQIQKLSGTLETSTTLITIISLKKEIIVDTRQSCHNR